MEAFKTLLSDTGEWRASLDGLSLDGTRPQAQMDSRLPSGSFVEK